MEHCVPLGRLSRADLAVAGGKGANLGELLRAGYAVPPGFVVTTGAYRASAVDGWRTVPEEVARAIGAAYDALGSPPVAVRSSATAEDLPGAAFAGQQDTYLNVVGLEPVLDAVRDCWASLRSARAVAYRERLGIPEDEVSMAVVVQQMARADWAGVMFTANPVTGSRDEVVIDSSPGLGESVVGGTVTPDHAVVGADGRVVERRGGRAESMVVPVAGGGTRTVVRDEAGRLEGVTDRDDAAGVTSALPDAVLVQLAQLGRSVAAHFGAPQDIEWVLGDGRILLTQARPMTALPPAPVRLTRLQRLTGPVLLELLPRRPLPLELTAWTDEVLDRHVGRMFGGMAGMRLDVGRILPREDGVLQSFVPPVPRPTRHTPLRIAGFVVRSVRHRARDWRDDPLTGELRGRMAALAARDVGDLTWPELQQVQPATAQILAGVGDVRARYLPSAVRGLAVAALAWAVLGRGRPRAELLLGASSETTRANDALAQLARLVRADAELRQAFAGRSGEDLLTWVATHPSATPLRAGLKRFLDDYGHRESSTVLMLRDPSWGSSPAHVLDLVRVLVDERAGGEQPRPDAGGQRDLPPVLRRLAERAAEGLALREDTHFEISRAMPGLRRALVEAGRRLAEHGWLERPEDVWWLVREELLSLPDPATGPAAPPGARGAAGDLRARVTRRRQAYAALAGSPLIAPSSLYPPSAKDDDAVDAMVRGVPGGGGRATGPVRVVTGPEAFGELRAGDVLVCRSTSPAWTPLFTRAAAVVVDHGGPASHAAIVAREYGLPVVLATSTGTTVLRTGQVVTVDGTRGWVLQAADQPAAPAAPSGLHAQGAAPRA